MSMKFLKQMLDIHCGGIDHVNVHHTNEIAQSEAATGKPFFNFWMHGAFLIINGGKKMAKSEGNFLTLKSGFIQKGIDPLVYRFAAFQTHYRKPMEYSPESIEAANNGLQHLRNQVRALTDDSHATLVDPGYQKKFTETLNNDLNMPQALAVVQKLLKSDLDPGTKLATIIDFDKVLGFDLNLLGLEKPLPDDIQALADARHKARQGKNWALSDQLRDQIQAMGFKVQDSPKGMKVLKR
jgi:cysteinyl-tRNA synthetase